ncbi:unnamed protein product [Rhizoctonia solani]|uniref:Uncharacterized protein n=1 Tax=Rhizoctonia solani TaxID=456999 RepID=A0A8H3GI34_9AGAM|nr:unnamed protein product [Rhizoctonia solani]CAE6524622.1 unnamed protein product [Rhizoctonia solani]
MQSFRIARSFAALPRLAPVYRVRTFRWCAPSRASEDADSFMAQFKNTPLFNKFAEQPEALAALGKIAEFLKKNDIDMTTPPSSMTMFKLFTNTEFRELTRNALEEFKKAGIDIKAENAMELFSQSQNPKGPR